MKTRTALRAGKAGGCSPEAANMMQKALAMEEKVANCVAKSPVYNGYYYPQRPYYGYYTPPTTVNPGYNVGYTYPDRSGACG
jgi:hypothetical protein